MIQQTGQNKDIWGVSACTQTRNTRHLRPVPRLPVTPTITNHQQLFHSVADTHLFQQIVLFIQYDSLRINSKCKCQCVVWCLKQNTSNIPHSVFMTLCQKCKISLFFCFLGDIHSTLVGIHSSEMSYIKDGRQREEVRERCPAVYQTVSTDISLILNISSLQGEAAVFLW